MDVTFLGKVKSYQHLTKLYGRNDTGEVVKLSDYDAGKLFRHTSVEVNDLEELRQALIAYGDGDYIRVHGNVNDKYSSHSIIKRRNTYLEQPEGGVRIFNLDLDGKDGNWVVEDEFELNDKEALRVILKEKLEQASLGFLNDYDCIFMWSQSAWTHTPLRGHVYWLLDEGVDLTLLRNWGRAHNELNPGYRLDTAVWKISQPDFIGRRRLEPGLIDLFKRSEDRFIYIGGDMMEDVLPVAELRKHIEKDIKNPLSHYSETSGPELGSTWQDTLLRVGKHNPDGDINGWCFRAAAQMVQELGSKYVMANLEHLTEEMHDRAWSSIGRNTEGARGDENDRNTYDRPRFRQYLTSAANKGFGDDKDTRVDKVAFTIQQAAETGDMAGLFAKDTLAHFAFIKSHWPGAWQELQYQIKTKLKGRVSIRDFRQAVDRNSGKSTLLNPGDMSEGGPDGEPGKVKLMQTVVGMFDWILDQDGTRWAGVRGDAGNYTLYGLDKMRDVFFFKAQGVDPHTPQHFGKMCLSYVLGGLSIAEGELVKEEQDRDQEDDGVFDLKWEKRIVAMQHYRDDRGVFWNLGKDPKGIGRVLHITRGNISRITTSKCLKQFGILWNNPQQTEPRRLAGDESYGGKDDIDLLWKYVLCDPQYRMKVTGWLINTLIHGDTQMVIELLGRSNSGKSSAGDFLRDLIDPVDPKTIEGRSRKGLEGLSKLDKYRAIQKNSVIYEDNKSGIHSQTQNLLCKVCTGMLADVRIMYTSTMEHIWLKRPVILTGIQELITQPDLVSRSLRVWFSETAGETAGFSSTEELKTGWKKDRPRILRALAELVLRVLNRIDKVKGRRGIYEQAMMVVYGEQVGAKKLAEEKFEQAYDSVQSSPFCLAWVAFIQERFNRKGIVEEHMVTRRWLDLYEEWWTNNSGRKVELELADGSYMEVVIAETNHHRTEKVLPSSARGFGALINKYANEMLEVAGVRGDKLVGKYKERSVTYEPLI